MKNTLEKIVHYGTTAVTAVGAGLASKVVSHGILGSLAISLYKNETLLNEKLAQYRDTAIGIGVVGAIVAGTAAYYKLKKVREEGKSMFEAIGRGMEYIGAGTFIGITTCISYLIISEIINPSFYVGIEKLAREMAISNSIGAASALAGPYCLYKFGNKIKSGFKKFIHE